MKSAVEHFENLSDEKRKLIAELERIFELRASFCEEEGLGVDGAGLTPSRHALAEEIRERSIMLMQSLVGDRAMAVSVSAVPKDDKLRVLKWCLMQAFELVPFKKGGMFGAPKIVSKNLVSDILDDLQGLNYGTSPEFLKPKPISGSNRQKWVLLKHQRIAVGWVHFLHAYSGRSERGDGWSPYREEAGVYYQVSGQTLKDWEDEVKDVFPTVHIKFQNARRVAKAMKKGDMLTVPMWFRGNEPRLFDYGSSPEQLMTKDGNEYRALKGKSILAVPKS